MWPCVPVRMQDSGSRINAAVAVACLVGHEEGNPRLQLDETLVGEMLDVLAAACEGQMRHGNFWTVGGMSSMSKQEQRP